MRSLRATALACAIFTSAVAPAGAQTQPAVQQIAPTDAMKAFAADLAQLQMLARRLDVSAAPIKPAPARSAPSNAVPQIFTIPQGETVTILKREGGWVQTRTDEGREGWVQEAFFGLLPSTEEIVASLIAMAKGFADKYRNGPVAVTGFSLSLGISPSLNVDFEFK